MFQFCVLCARYYEKSWMELQIENEYTLVEAAFGEKGPPYVQWAAKMAVSLQTGVPWSMCKQNDAPDPVVFFCQKYLIKYTLITFPLYL